MRSACSVLAALALAACAACSRDGAPIDTFAGAADGGHGLDAVVDATDAAAVDATDAAAVDTTNAAVDATDAADALAVCPADMVSIPGACVDRYEAPNVAGAAPLAMQTALDGEAWCEARGKRLCTEAEWVRACEGASERKFPYGTTYVRGRCNDDKTWKSPSWSTLGTWPADAAKKEAERLYQADPSGSRDACVSEEGAFDLTGNVAEWVVRSFPNSTNYDHVMKGCYWSGCYGGAPPSCAFVNPAHPGGFRTYEAGFRCCRSR